MRDITLTVIKIHKDPIKDINTQYDQRRSDCQIMRKTNKKKTNPSTHTPPEREKVVQATKNHVQVNKEATVGLQTKNKVAPAEKVMGQKI